MENVQTLKDLYSCKANSNNHLLHRHCFSLSFERGCIFIPFSVSFYQNVRYTRAHRLHLYTHRRIIIIVSSALLSLSLSLSSLWGKKAVWEIGTVLLSICVSPLMWHSFLCHEASNKITVPNKIRLRSIIFKAYKMKIEQITRTTCGTRAQTQPDGFHTHFSNKFEQFQLMYLRWHI